MRDLALCHVLTEVYLGIGEVVDAGLASHIFQVLLTSRDFFMSGEQPNKGHRINSCLTALVKEQVQPLTLNLGAQLVIDLGDAVLDEVTELLLGALKVVLRTVEEHVDVGLDLLHHVADLVCGERALTVSLGFAKMSALMAVARVTWIVAVAGTKKRVFRRSVSVQAPATMIAVAADCATLLASVSTGVSTIVRSTMR